MGRVPLSKTILDWQKLIVLVDPTRDIILPRLSTLKFN